MTIDTPEGIELFHMKAQAYALRLEMIGLKHSRGSVYAHIKRTYGLRGSKQKVLDQLADLIEETEIEYGFKK
jgi:hypothetical protein